MPLLTLSTFLLMAVKVKWCTAHTKSSRTHGGPALANCPSKQRPRTLVNSALNIRTQLRYHGIFPL